MTSPSITIERLDEPYRAAYERFVSRRADGLIYYTWRFRNFLIALLGAECRSLVAVSAVGEVVGIMPAFAVNGPYGTVLNSSPFFGSNGGVLADNSRIAAQLISAYREMARDPTIASATLIENPLGTALIEQVGDIYDERIGQITSIPTGNTEALDQILDVSALRNVRKARSSGVTVERNASYLKDVGAMHHENIAAIGGRTKPKMFYDLIHRFFRQGIDWDLYVARKDRDIIAGLLLFYSGRTTDYYIPATAEGARPWQPMAALIYSAMQDAQRAGRLVWNWGGTWPSQDGVLRFKRKWGATDQKYRYHVTINNPLLYGASKEAIMESYGYFYVLPFTALQP